MSDQTNQNMIDAVNQAREDGLAEGIRRCREAVVEYRKERAVEVGGESVHDGVILRRVLGAIDTVKVE